jgi:FXSXX-COOH protein
VELDPGLIEATSPAPARVPLAQLAEAGTRRLAGQLQRALPGDEQQQPAVAAFNSSI